MNDGPAEKKKNENCWTNIKITLYFVGPVDRFEKKLHEAKENDAAVYSFVCDVVKEVLKKSDLEIEMPYKTFKQEQSENLRFCSRDYAFIRLPICSLEQKEIIEERLKDIHKYLPYPDYDLAYSVDRCF